VLFVMRGTRVRLAMSSTCQWGSGGLCELIILGVFGVIAVLVFSTMLTTVRRDRTQSRAAGTTKLVEFCGRPFPA
jgi:hypothetical protein